MEFGVHLPQIEWDGERVTSPARCADLFARYQAAGVGRVLVWPVGDELEQVERFAAEVIPAVQAARDDS